MNQMLYIYLFPAIPVIALVFVGIVALTFSAFERVKHPELAGAAILSLATLSAVALALRRIACLLLP